MKNIKIIYCLLLLSIFTIMFNTIFVNAAVYTHNNNIYNKSIQIHTGAIGTPAITLSFPLYILDNLSDKNASDVFFEITDEYGNLIDYLRTDSSGVSHLGDFLAGTYYINIIDSPFELIEDKYYSFTLEATTHTSIHFYYEQDAIIGPPIIVPNLKTYDNNCVPSSIYKITDKEDNALIQAQTDERGIFYIPLDLFELNEVYYFTIVATPEELSDYEMVTVPFVIDKNDLDIEIILYPRNFKYKKGDLNRDGVINSNDAAIALDLYNNNNATNIDIEIGDIDQNNIINSTDAALILDIYMSGI